MLIGGLIDGIDRLDKDGINKRKEIARNLMARGFALLENPNKISKKPGEYYEAFEKLEDGNLESKLGEVIIRNFSKGEESPPPLPSTRWG